MVELTTRELGVPAPPLETYYKTLFSIIIAVLVLLLMAFLTDLEENEGRFSFITVGVILLLLTIVVFYETVTLTSVAVEAQLEGKLVCVHCHNLMEVDTETLTIPVICSGCERPLDYRWDIVTVNYGSVLTSLGIPALVERLGRTKLEYSTLVGEKTGLRVQGDLIAGDKIDVRDSVVSRSQMGSGGEAAEDDTAAQPIQPAPVDFSVEDELKAMTAELQALAAARRVPGAAPEEDGELDTD